MRKALRVSLLVMVLASTARAGDMPYGLTNPPPPPPQAVSSTEQVNAEITDVEIPNGQPEAITIAVLNLLQSVLSAF